MISPSIHPQDDDARLHPDPQQLIHVSAALLEALGEDPRREGLQDTPARHAKFLTEFVTPEPVMLTTFEAEAPRALVTQTRIPFYSLCEHHLVPFFGHATIGYRPRKRIIGLSKLARLVQFVASRPQNQERITGAVAEELRVALDPDVVGVQLRARHLCMEMRGIRAYGAETVTSVWLAAERTRADEAQRLRAEFQGLAG